MPPTPEEKRAALEDVVRTATFVRAGQLQNFLRLVCEMEITGRAGEINEYLIGVEVLGRAEGYSPSQDSVVRRRAVDLREKLDVVYSTELAAAKVRIELPKGRYVPRFVRVDLPIDGAKAASSPAATGPTTPAGVRTRLVAPLSLAAAFLAGVAVTSGAFLSLFRGADPATSRPPGTTYEAEAHGNTLSGTASREPCEVCSGGGTACAASGMPRRATS